MHEEQRASSGIMKLALPGRITEVTCGLSFALGEQKMMRRREFWFFQFLRRALHFARQRSLVLAVLALKLRLVDNSWEWQPIRKLNPILAQPDLFEPDRKYFYNLRFR